MIYHILNGDCLAMQLAETAISGEVIICRECIIEGPLSPFIDEKFWHRRSEFIGLAYDETEEGYNDKVRSQFNLIANLPNDAEVNLWFEDDLFCQANLWLILHLLHQQDHKGAVYRVFPVIPQSVDHWQGFGTSTGAALEQALAQRVLFTIADMAFGEAIWQTYSTSNFEELVKLSHADTKLFNRLPEVVQAHIERFYHPSRPIKAIKDIIAEGKNTFKEVFPEFTRRQGIYGFGDLQVKWLYDGVVEG